LLEKFDILFVKDIKIQINPLIEILRSGLPFSIQMSLLSINNIFVQRNINLYGPIIISANTAAASIETMIYNVINSIYSSSVVFISYNHGAKKIILRKLYFAFHQVLFLFWF